MSSVTPDQPPHSFWPQGVAVTVFISGTGLRGFHFSPCCLGCKLQEMTMHLLSPRNKRDGGCNRLARSTQAPGMLLLLAPLAANQGTKLVTVLEEASLGTDSERGCFA